MLKIITILFFLVSLSTVTSAQKAPAGTGVAIAPGATHIARIQADSIVVISGSTYSFTVDTPEDQGLVSTTTTVANILGQIQSIEGSVQRYQVRSKAGSFKTQGELESGDELIVTAKNGKATFNYKIIVSPMALTGQLALEKKERTTNGIDDLTLYYTAGQRTPDATVNIVVPAGIEPTLDNTTVNVIGRGDVKLSALSKQSIGRVASKYSYSRVGEVAISKLPKGGAVITFNHLDLRPANGADLKLVFHDVQLKKEGKYVFSAQYITSQPARLTSSGNGAETAILTVKHAIADFERITENKLDYQETGSAFTTVHFRWPRGINAAGVQLLQSLDGKTWTPAATRVNLKTASVAVSNLNPGKMYTFRLHVKDGLHKGYSNEVKFFSGKMDIKMFGVNGIDNTDHTDGINKAIAYVNSIGGGTLMFSKGTYSVRTVHLKSNVYLYIGKDAVIKALKGADAPETTWFSDKKYRSGLSPTDTGPYADPENWLTKQDVGHTFFRNAMFFGERLDNVKIVGNGLITGNGNLVTSDRVMNNPPDNRADKMFSLKLCTNVEIGGLFRPEDLWYDSTRDEPYYILKDGTADRNVNNMLQIERGGHFVLLATGTDNINVLDTYFAKNSASNARDIYDFMGCNNVSATNIYSKVSSDDIVKPGSDCSLGFTRPAKRFRVRNIIGDTNCNLFQIGSETADDIMDACVDNIYVLGANKAGFSISTNDGGHVKDIHLNCGHTGKLHSRSKMFRTTTPFFISISNRGRILGATVSRYKFIEEGVKHDELLVTNLNIGRVENIIINGVDIYEVYGGSAYGGKRWKPFDGSQKKATPIIAGYSLPESKHVEGGLDFKLPNGQHTGYITNIEFHDVHVLVKGGNPPADTAQTPPELGVGQYNVSNLKVQPSYGLWARHVKGLKIKESSFNYEQPDGRYAIFLDDVIGAELSGVKMVSSKMNHKVIKLKNARNLQVFNSVFYNHEWGNAPQKLEIGNIAHAVSDVTKN